MGNQFRTALLLAIMTVFLIVIGRLIGGPTGMVVAFVFAIGMNFFSYWFSDKIVLRMYRAREVTPDQAPELYQMVATLAQRANLPMPRVYIIPQGYAQCLCHRPQSRTCGGGCHSRVAQTDATG
jgi:heat shock protein HtpX